MGRGACFVSGSRIRAARGEVPVQDLSPGDAVAVLRNGAQTFEPVKWIGYTQVDIARHAHPEDIAPIRIRAGAITDNQPARDLLVSPEHCMVIDGLCVPAKLLVNGGSILTEYQHAPFTYYHLELENHGVLYAEDAETESYLDTGNRSVFDNAEGPRQLHPRFTLDSGSARWATDACAPLARIADQVEPIWARLAARSQTIGYPIPQLTYTGDADIHLRVDGRAIRPASHSGTRYVFMVPAGASSVALLSRFCIPADKFVARERDTRRLGVRVDSIAIRTGATEVVLAADDPRLADGWHDVERDDSRMWRWTDGAGVIPVTRGTEALIITIDCTPLDAYPAAEQETRRVA
ncbi:MAG: Hint domain-containing protein [Proteobacteria bacterium]|nr:Hint domain-containing protein [Pseudomonadota bacterium]